MKQSFILYIINYKKKYKKGNKAYCINSVNRAATLKEEENDCPELETTCNNNICSSPSIIFCETNININIIILIFNIL